MRLTGQKGVVDYLSHNLACGLSLTDGVFLMATAQPQTHMQKLHQWRPGKPEKKYKTMRLGKYDPEQITET